MNKNKIQMSSNRSFGLFFFLILFVVAIWGYDGHLSSINTLLLFFSLIFLFLGLINSNILTPLNKIWFKFGLFLGKIVSPVVMYIIFFFIVTPIGLFMRLIGKDLIKIKYDKKIKSYWIKRDKINSSMKKQF